MNPVSRLFTHSLAEPNIVTDLTFHDQQLDLTGMHSLYKG